jgi:hypothetical protein
MLITFAAVVLGGVISILSQVTLDSVRQRSHKREKEAESQAAIRVIRFHFYAAQHVLKESLETGRWWSGPAGLDVAVAGEDLNRLAGLLPDEEWRIYTAAWRRLCSCIRRYEASRLLTSEGSTVVLTEPIHGENSLAQSIEPTDLQFLLGTFVTVDDARRRLQHHSVDRLSGDVRLSRLGLTDQEKIAALDLAGHLIDRSRWQEILLSSDGGSPS